MIRYIVHYHTRSREFKSKKSALRFILYLSKFLYKGSAFKGPIELRKVY